MSEEVISQEYLYELYDKCNSYGHYYHDLDSPIVPDEIYDDCMQKVKYIENIHPEWIRSDSPIKHVSGSASKKNLEKIQHPEQMQSLDDKFSEMEVEKWFLTLKKKITDNISFNVEAKVDGLSVALEYINGIFVSGSTRGDGWVGEDVTENLKRVNGIPHNLYAKENHGVPERNKRNILRVRAEVVMFNDEFQRVNREREANGEQLFANPRNAAAGTLRVLNPEVVEQRGLTAIAFEILYAEGFEDWPSEWRPGELQSVNLQFLDKLGFVTVPHLLCNDLNDIYRAINTIETKRLNYSYWTDGAVIKVNNILLQQQIGKTTKYPKWAIAYKYKSEERITNVLDVVVQTGRTGVLTPKVEFEPVILGGTTVRFATLHNLGYIKALGNIAIGDEIVVNKAAEIIPQVVKVNLEKRKPKVKLFEIEKCPSCGAKPIIKVKDEIEVAYCPNIKCPAQKSKYFEFIVSRDVLNIRGMGNAIISLLVNEGLLKKRSDIFFLSRHEDELIKMPRLGKKTVNNILLEIEDAKLQPLHRIIKCLGIPGCGNHVGKILERNFNNMDTIMSLSEEDLVELEGIGSTIAKAIVDFFSETENIQFINEMKLAGVNMTSNLKQAKRSNDFIDLNFVITGGFMSMNRGEIIKAIEDNGGRVSGSVSKKTDYLIVGNNPGSKLVKAQTLDVKMLSEEEFMKLIN